MLRNCCDYPCLSATKKGYFNMNLPRYLVNTVLTLLIKFKRSGVSAISFLLFFMLSSGLANAIPPQQSVSSNTYKLILVCESDYAEYATDCENMTNTVLEILSNQYLALPVNPECEMNPNDITCGNISIGLFQAVDYIFTYPTSDYYVVKRVTNNAFGPLTSIVNTSEYDVEFSKVKQLDQLKKDVDDTYHFVENSYGEFINKNGDSIDEVAKQYGVNTASLYYKNAVTVSSNTDNEFPASAGCRTAVDYVIVPGCASAINGMIDAVDSSENSAMRRFGELFETFDIDFGFLKASLKNEKSFDFKLERNSANDNSVLVLTITPSSQDGVPPSIVIDSDQSRNSSGLTFNYLENSLNGNVSGLGVSGAELASYLQGPLLGLNCGSGFGIIGYDREYFVTVVRDSAGTRIYIDLLSSTPIYGTVEPTCSSTSSGFPQFNF